MVTAEKRVLPSPLPVSTRKPKGSRFPGGSPLPGFGLSLGFTLLYLCLIILIPISTVFLKTATLTWAEFLSLDTTTWAATYTAN